MKRRYKLLIIILIGSIVTIIINNVEPRDKITLVAMGDSLSIAKTPFGIAGTSFTDYLKEYLDNNHKLKKYNYDYSYDHLLIDDLYDYLANNNVKNKIPIKQLIAQADLLTIAIGPDEMADISLRKDIESDDIFSFLNSYEKLLKNIRNFYKNKIIVIGLYPVYNFKQSEVIELNKKLSIICGKYNTMFIDIIPYAIDDEYHFSNDNYYLNYKVHKKIYEIIIKSEYYN